MAGKIAPETPRAGVVFVDGWLGALWATQVGRASSSILNPVSTLGVSLGPNEPCVAHLVPVVPLAPLARESCFDRFFFDLPRLFPKRPPPQF